MIEDRFAIDSDEADDGTVRLVVPSLENGIQITAHNIDRLIAILAIARGAMSPPVEREVDRPPPGVLNPHYFCGDGEISGYKSMSLRHPGLGWSHYTFSYEAAQKLGQALLARPARTMQ